MFEFGLQILKNSISPWRQLLLFRGYAFPCSSLLEHKKVLVLHHRLHSAEQKVLVLHHGLNSAAKYTWILETTPHTTLTSLKSSFK